MKKLAKIILISILAYVGTLSAEDASHLENYPLYYFSDNIYIMQHIQAKLDNAKFIVFGLQNIGAIKNLSDDQKKMLENVYVISAKTGDIVYSQINTLKNPNDKHTLAGDNLVRTRENASAINGKAPDGKAIADKTINFWQADESRIIYDVGDYFTTVVITKDRDLYILAVPDIYLVTN